MWKSAKAVVKEHKGLERLYANKILAAMGDAYELVVNGNRWLTAGSQTRRTTCSECGHVEESAPFRVLRPSKEKES